MIRPLLKEDINVLPERYRRRLLKRKQILFLLALGFLLTLVVPIYQLVSSTISETSKLNGQLTILNGQKAVKLAAIAERDQQQKVAQEFQTISDYRTTLLDDLNIINSVTKDQRITISNVNIDSEIIVVTCAITQWDNTQEWKLASDAFNDYIDLLEQTGEFTSIEFAFPDFLAAPNATIEICPDEICTEGQ